MEKKEMSIAEFVTKKFDTIYPEKVENTKLSKYRWSYDSKWGKYSLPSHCFGFYDWFCHNFSLAGKARRLSRIVRMIAKFNKVGNRFDPTKCYVFFKNNCPCYGDYRNYDDIRICDIESGEVIFNICPRDPYGNVMLFCKGHGFERDTEGIKFESLRDLEKWFAA